MNNSKLNFYQLIAEIPNFSQVFWNGKCVFISKEDDYDTLFDFLDKYNQKIVYSLKIDINETTCILNVEGETLND